MSLVGELGVYRVSSMILHVPLGPSAAEQMARLPDRSGAELRTAEGCDVL